MLYSVGFTKMELDVYDSSDLSRERVKLTDFVDFIKKNGMYSVKGISFFNDNMQSMIESGEFEKVSCINKVTAKYYRPLDKELVFVCVNERPFIDKDIYIIDQPDFKMYFKSGVALVIWHKGYLYNIEFKEGVSSLLNGDVVDLNIIPNTLAYVAKNSDNDGYSLFLFNKWLEVRGDRLLCTLNHGIYYGKKGSFDIFKKVISHYTGKYHEVC